MNKNSNLESLLRLVRSDVCLYLSTLVLFFAAAISLRAESPSYAGVYIAHQAISKAPSPDDHKAIRDALVQIKGMNTVLGTFSFTAGRDADYVPVVQVVKVGKFAVYGE